MLLTLSAIASCSIGYARDLGNFVFIMTDNNACGDLACYGAPDDQNPEHRCRSGHLQGEQRRKAIEGNAKRKRCKKRR